MRSESHALEPVGAERPAEGLRLLELALRRRWTVYAWALALALLFPPSVSGVFYSFWLLPLFFVGLVLRTHRALLYLQSGHRRLALEAARAMVEESQDTPQVVHHKLVYCHVLLECGELDRAKEKGVFEDEEVALDTEVHLKKALIQAKKPEPDKKSILDHLNEAKALIEGVTAAAGLVGAFATAAQLVQKLF